MNPPGRAGLSAVILAGGQSRRMGRDKAWIVRDGRPLIARSLDVVRRLGVRELFISGRAGVDYSALGCPVLVDEVPDLGPLGGIERALAECTSPLLLVLAVDLARMTTAFLRRLVRHCESKAGVVPELNGELEPLAAIYPQRCRPIARDALAGEGRSARAFARACLKTGFVTRFPVAESETGCFANWNSPEDFAALCLVSHAGAASGRPAHHSRPKSSHR